MKTRKKLIEVALPLEAINIASAREKSIRHGHPSTLHLWWARRPLAAARAVIFSQMVDDPSEYVDTLREDPTRRRKAETTLKARTKTWDEATKVAKLAERSGMAAPAPGPQPTLDDILAEHERERLFRIIEDLVQWENTTNESVLQKARDEIWQSWRRTCADNADHPRARELFDRNKLPAFHDPFAGGGALPLEAQRLGLESYASDLNPVAVLINKAMIEIPPKFAGRPPVNPEARQNKELFKRTWKGAEGLAEDVRYYGQWMRDEAAKQIGYLYPTVEITTVMATTQSDLRQYIGKKLTVVAWLWARTVKSPNPAFSHVDVPLASTFLLSTKHGKETFVEPVIKGDRYSFVIKARKSKNDQDANHGTSAGKRSAFRCLLSGVPITYEYIREEARAGRMGAKLLAIVADGERGRVFIAPTVEHEDAAARAKPQWKPDSEFFQKALGFRVGKYGMTKWSDIYTSRQLVLLTTFSDLIQQARERVMSDARVAGLAEGDATKPSYAEAVSVYLSCAVGRLANAHSSLVGWINQNEAPRNTFARQALPMVWDFCEANAFGVSAGNWIDVVEGVTSAIKALPGNARVPGRAFQVDAAGQSDSVGKVVSTDPPYYDNIGYADLSDFFYVWLRRCLRSVLSDLFITLEVPKADELVATPARHGGKANAAKFFLMGMTAAMHRLAEQTHPSFPITVYYAFKQSESESDYGTSNTGWETFLDALIRAGFTTTGTWPIRTEKPGRMRENDSNALASSIVLVCRKRDSEAQIATRRQFVSALKNELLVALAHLQRGNIAPVDLAQAAIGPGMAIYTRYAQVLDAEGRPLSVRQALVLINQTLDDVLSEQEGDFDSDSRWALAWFDQSGFADGEYGVAETLSKAKNTSVQGLVESGILRAGRGKVRLLRPEELPDDWDPATDNRLSAWEIVHHLIRTKTAGGEGAAAELVTRLGVRAETARELCYRLYTVCERKKWAAEALAYNDLVQSWPEITRLAQEGTTHESTQPGLL